MTACRTTRRTRVPSRRIRRLAAVAMLFPALCAAQPHEEAPHAAANRGESDAVTTPSEPLDRGWPEPVDDSTTRGFLLFDNLEYQATDGPDPLRWDLFGWYGGDTERLWFKSEGRAAFAPAKEAEEVELQLLYGRHVSPYFDLQAGMRFDPRTRSDGSPERTYAVIGLQGLAPYQFEVEPTLFLSEKGHVAARLTATYDILLSQRLVLQPRLETNLRSDEDPAIGLGSGLNDLELGFRVRYEVRREVAPYVGLTWRETYGTTHRLALEEGDASHLAAVAGVRLWF